MQGKITARGQFTVHGNQVLHITHLARQHNAVMRQTQFLGAFRAIQRRYNQRFARDLGSFFRLRQLGVLIHHAHNQIGIQAAPVNPDAHRFIVAFGNLDHHRELIFAFAVLADIAGIDAVFR